MIHEKYLEQAFRIRKDFTETNLRLIKLSDELRKVNDNIQETVSNLEKIYKNIDTYNDEKELIEDINKHLKTFEVQSDKIQKKFVPLSNEMEDLKKEEEEFYDKLVEKYPHLSQDDIVKQVHNYLRKKEGND